MPYSLSAQTALPNNPAILPNDFNELLKPETTDGWFFLKDSLYVYPDTLFTKYKNWWGLGTNDKMKFEKKLTDKIGGNHYDYKLFHKGIEVYPLMVRVHDYIEKGLVANGRLIKNLAIDTSVIITKAQAISNALYNINATKYYWEDSIAQSSIKSIKNNQNATYYPNPVLVIIHLNADRNFNHVDFKLAYKLIVGIKEPEDNILTYFIDAIYNPDNSFETWTMGSDSGTSTPFFTTNL